MTLYIALLRGINVGGKHKLPMAELTALLTELGVTHIKTYIQSGNAIFQAEAVDRDTLAESIRTAIAAKHGFAPHVLLLEADELAAAMAANPFPEGEANPKTLHLYFLTSAPREADPATLAKVQMAGEQFQLADTIFYLYTPDGIGRSKLAAQVESALGVHATARNWRSVSKIMALAKSAQEEAANDAA